MELITGASVYTQENPLTKLDLSALPQPTNTNQKATIKGGVCFMNTIHGSLEKGLDESVNDPSAGSPTETLLRLLLPLNATVWSSSRQAVRVIRLPNSPRTSLKRSIGSSDGRCVQRAGT